MKKFLLLFIALLASAPLVFAQYEAIHGTVNDEAGKPVSGASVSIMGTSFGTSANAAGEFIIHAKAGQTLQISALGFITAEIKIGTSNSINILLKHGDNLMQEVVVTALGQTSSKEKLGYATSTFNAKEINRTANVNAYDALAGKVAGAEISNTGGPGSSTKIILRGYGVIAGGSNQPLYVIDGVPLSNSRAGSDNGGLTTQNDFGNGANDINPNDIASITVLKVPLHLLFTARQRATAQ